MNHFAILSLFLLVFIREDVENFQICSTSWQRFVRSLNAGGWGKVQRRDAQAASPYFPLHSQTAPLLPELTMRL